jgi:protein-S-isoprenylcysteine O-methyltransferase Ste14
MVIAGFVFILFYLVFLFVIFFLAAGDVSIVFAWVSLGIYAVISIVNVFLVDPSLVAERMQFGGKGVDQVDRLLASVSFLFYLPVTLIVAGLDIGRFAWSPGYPLSIQILALVLFTLGNLFARWAMARNKFFSTFVRIQDDRSHVVVSDGPYKYIRHPGYAGAILAGVTLPLALGSWVALIPAVIGCFGFVMRTAREDKELIHELEGYRQYTEQVPYRLVPGVW